MGNATLCEPYDLEDGRVRFHRFRYHLARGFIDPFDRVLDLGCGTGYGSDMLSEITLDVEGYDMEQGNIDYSHKNHKGCGIVYHCTDLEKMEIPEADVAVSFEVIEHLYKPAEFINKLKEKIKRLIIVSVPVGQELVWMEEAKEFQEKGDSTHKSVFPTPDYFKSLFIDDNWKEFYSWRDGVTFIAIFYNKNEIPRNIKEN
jgi:SAM-dependent methyltransferase